MGRKGREGKGGDGKEGKGREEKGGQKSIHPVEISQIQPCMEVQKKPA